MSKFHWLAIGYMVVLSISNLRARADIAGAYSSNYSLTSIGAVPSSISAPGGIVIVPSSPNTLLVGNASDGNIYAFDLTRNTSGHITGFGSGPTLYASAPGLNCGLFGYFLDPLLHPFGPAHPPSKTPK